MLEPYGGVKVERRNEVQVQDEPSRRDHMLEACHPYGVHGDVKICLKERLSHSGVWGSNLQYFTKHEQEYSIKKGVPSWGGQDRHHLAQVECTRQRYYLDRFSLLPVSWWWWETGFRIDNRTIKRGSRSEYLDRIVQRELKPLHTCHHIFLDSYLAFIHMRIYILCLSPCQALVHQKRISNEYRIGFLMLEVLPIRHL